MSRRPRVLLVIDRVSERAGAEGSTVLLLRRLHGSAVDFRIVTVGGGVELADRDALQGAGVVFDEAGGGLAEGIRAVRAAVDSFRPDLVHAVLFHAELVARLACYRRVPVLGSIVSTQYSAAAREVARSPWKLEVVRRVDGLLARRATTHLHSVSEAAAREAVRSLGVRRADITVIRRGRDDAVLGRRTTARRAAARAELGIEEDTPVILGVGRQDPPKRLDLLVRAFAPVAAQDPRAVLLIAGRRGSASELVDRVIQEEGLTDRVRLLGQRDDVADLLAACDVFAFSSTYEGMPGAVIEALALEAPVVAFDIAPVREVTEGAALLVPIADHEAMGSAVGRLLDDPALRDRLRADGRRRFQEQFSIERYSDEFATLYRSLTIRKAAGSENRAATRRGGRAHQA